MGILDDAIREHLELKRQHGAEEKEIEGLEAEAFGPADRPEAVEPDTRILSPEEAAGPESSESGPAPETGSEAIPAADTGEAGEPGPAPEVQVPETPPEAAVPEPPAEPAPAETAAPMPPADPVGATVPDVTGDPGPTSEDPGDFGDEEGDAGDLLEAERHRLSGQPTEHYDVDAAIAEENELDILSESSLSDELDRALEGRQDSVSRQDAADPESEYEPVTADPPAEGAAGELEDAEYEAVMDTPADEEPDDAQPDEEPEADGPEEDLAADFFDQEDPLEGTPDFLEETPDHDRLWFEQKEPKDFDFGD